MAKTRSQTGNITIKKEEEEKDCKDNLLLNGDSNTRNKITKRKSSRSKNRPLPAQQIKMEEDTDTKSLLQSSSKSSKLPKGRYISQEQINQLIDAIVNDNMTITKASHMAKVSKTTGCNYYNLYKNDPDKKIPSVRSEVLCPARFSTLEQIENLIKYINEDKMTIKEASEKANMNHLSGKHFYNKYLQDPNHNVPIPQTRHCFTQGQKDEFIGYIVNDRMDMTAASRKAKISISAAKNYYHKYFNVQNPDIAPPSHIANCKRLKQEQIKEVIGYIVKGKMTITAASRKLNMCPETTRRHYRRCLKDNNMEIPVSKYCKRYTQDDINELIGYIVHDKMTIMAASKKANMDHSTGKKYYHQYLKQHNLDIPTPKYVTRDQIDELIGYIAKNKMSINDASKSKYPLPYCKKILPKISNGPEARCT